MSAKPLDLATIDPPIWHVLAGEKVYGPYTIGQLRTFVAEGRVAPDTQLAPREGGPFERAGEITALSAIFQPTGLGTEPQPQDTASPAQVQGPQPANFLIVAKLTGVRAEVLRRVLNELGNYTEAAAGIHVLRTATSLQRVRARIETVVSTEDQVVIVDASHDRLGFIHLGPETDVRVRAVWNSRLR